MSDPRSPAAAAPAAAAPAAAILTEEAAISPSSPNSAAFFSSTNATSDSSSNSNSSSSVKEEAKRTRVGADNIHVHSSLPAASSVPAPPTSARPSEPQRRRPSSSSRTATAGAASTSRTPPQLPAQQQEAEELTQLARSLRSEIVGEPFLLTAAFSPVSRVPSGGGLHRSGDRRRSATSPSSSPAAAAGAATAPSMLPLVPVVAASAATPRGLRRNPSDVPLPPSALLRRPADGAAASAGPCGADGPMFETGACAALTATASSPLLPSPSSPPVAAVEEEEDNGVEASGLHSVAELRRRLLTEDFFSSPFRKFRRDGKFPWKLVTSVVLCVLLVLQVMWYQLPLSRANESMRRAITEHFMGDDFESKGHGDIVAAPTAWMEGLYASIEHYVAVYYNLSNTSSSDMNYYYVASPGIGDADAAAGAWANRSRAVSPFVWRGSNKKNNNNRSTLADALVDAEVATSEQPAPRVPAIPLNAIAPVLMRVQVDGFSRREGSQGPASYFDAHGERWWSFVNSSAAAAFASRDETRWLTFYVDAAHPLGPLAKYRDAARRLRRAGKAQHRRAHALRKANKAAAKLAKKAMQGKDEDGAGGERDGTGGALSSSNGAVDAALAMVCTPRLDELSGRFYRPCASVPAALTSAEVTAAEVAAETLPPPSSFFPEFSLMDNVRAIQLEVTLRHETGDGGNTLRGTAVSDSAVSAADAAVRPPLFPAKEGEGGLAGLVRRHRPRGVTGGAVEEEAAVFQWRVTKTIDVHPGGLVETQLHVQTRIWPKGTTLQQRWGPSHTMAALLGLLAVLELTLRVRALWRIQQYQRRLHRERVAFHARQMREAATAAAATTQQPQPPLHRHPTGNFSSTAIPYEWGFPGTPAVRPVPSGPATSKSTTAESGVAAAFLLPAAEAAGHTTYGTLPRPHGGFAEAAVARRPCRVAPLTAESSPLLVRDTSISILAAQHPAAATAAARLVSDGEADNNAVAVVSFSALPSTSHPSSLSEDTRSVHQGSVAWLRRQVRRVFPRRGGAGSSAPAALSHAPLTAAADSCDSLNATPTVVRPPPQPVSTPTAAALRGSFRTPLLHGVSPLTPQLTERMMERSYVDLHTTWRHHLQQSMGAGWHVVGIVAAALTLSYSALLLLPLLPVVEVAQDGRYDAWTSVLLGTAALTSCVLLLSYLRFFPTLYFPILASTHVLPKLFLFALCVSPLFFGFAVFFMVAFGPYSSGHFDSLGWASMGLYLMTYGDSLLDTVDILSDTPNAVTAFFASVMVITFALLFMTIMLNIAMTITQHEWLRLRRRFGAALSSSSLLFSVRSRTQVKAEAVEAVRANLEVLWCMLAEEEEEKAAARAALDEAAAFARTHAPLPIVTGNNDTSTTTSATTSAAAVASGSAGSVGRRTMRRGGGRAFTRRSRSVSDNNKSRGERRAEVPAVDAAAAAAAEEEEREEEGEGDGAGTGSREGGGGVRGMQTAGSSYEVSAATTVPPD